MTTHTLKTLAFGVFFVLALSGVEDCKNTGPTPTGIEISLFHTNDIHSQLTPETAGSEKNPYSLGGLARLKTLYDRQRAISPNSLLLDAGDWSEGHVYYNVDAGSNVLRILDAIGYNAVVVGNHDFLNGPSELASTIERASPRFPVLGANRDLSAVADRARVESRLKEYAIFKTANDVRVAVVGLLTEEFTFYEYFKPGKITSAVQAASAITRKLHDEKLADVIVLLSHNAFSQNMNLAKQVPWVNVVISGHSHVKTAEPVVVTNAGEPVYVVEAKQWGQFLGQMNLLVDKAKRQVRLKGYTLHPVSHDLLQNPVIEQMVKAEETRLELRYGRPILSTVHAHCEDEMPLAEDKEGPLGNLLADSYRAVTGADLAMESGRLAGVGISPGALTEYQVLNMNPHIFSPIPGQIFPMTGKIWTLKRMKMKGADLWTLLNVALIMNTKIQFNIGWIGVSGARVLMEPTGDGFNPLHMIEIQNQFTGAYEPIQREKDYVLAIHDGLLLSVRLMVSMLHLNMDISRIEETGIDVGSALLQFASREKNFQAVRYEAGTRYRTVEPDLGMFEHMIKRVPSGIEVQVQNYGSQPAAGAKLQLFRGNPNDAVNDYTPGNERVLVAEMSLGTISPGQRFKLTLPWANGMPSAIYAIRAQVTSDANPSNDTVTVHLKY